MDSAGALAIATALLLIATITKDGDTRILAFCLSCFTDFACDEKFQQTEASKTRCSREPAPDWEFRGHARRIAPLTSHAVAWHL